MYGCALRHYLPACKGQKMTPTDLRSDTPSPTRWIADHATSRDNNFNLIRILAATGVLVSHAYPLSLGPAALQPLEGILQGLTLGTVCVWIFFAISGFFIIQSFARKQSTRAFLAARVLRLVPALVVVTVITIAVAGLLLTQAPQPVFWAEAGPYFIRNLLLFELQYTLPGVFETNPYGGAINGSLWSLSYEVTCYAGVFLCGIFGLIARPRIFACLVVLFLGAYAAGMLGDLHPRLSKLTELGLPFLIGMIFYIWRHHIPLSGTLLAGLAALAVLAWFTPLFMPVFAVALSYAIFMLGYARTPIVQRYNRLGDYSYGLYIYAFPIQQLVAQTGVTTPVLNMAIALPFTIICAVISWHVVEHPAMQLRHRVSGLTRQKIR
jgi:peptidoglycan/LPS O-acetylase OafA/YrhL